MNQCATPGLGSIMAGRYIAGAGQLLLSLGATALILLWFANILKVAYSIMDTSGEPDLKSWMGFSGFGLLFLAWCWAWISSVGILRQVRVDQHNQLDSPRQNRPTQPVPPRIVDK